ncbi:hypothetical protein ACFSCX_02450 [Bacillus salitolerans]|uniref:Helix-turn-helix domain-containing protein n=1 Tax=Bacillus salitolerans TaxID=1437434 RepID=A0ABW4LKY1_9BACI
MNNLTLSNKSWKAQSITDKLTDIALEQNKMLAANKGYVISPQKIIRCSRVSDLEIRLLQELMSLMGGINYAFPGHKRLAYKLRKKSTTSIKKALTALRDKGFIEWQIGGGDLGTNHYRVKNLFYNPYLIMSEATDYCVEIILEKYRGVIQYEELYGAIMDFMEPRKDIIDTEADIYGLYIKHLFDFPEDRDCPNLYITYCDRLSDHIESRTGIPIDILWDSHFIEIFKSRLNQMNIEEDKAFDTFFSEATLIRTQVIEEKFGYPLFDEIPLTYKMEEQTDLLGYQNTQIFIDAEYHVNELGNRVTNDQKCFARGKYITSKIFELIEKHSL